MVAGGPVYWMKKFEFIKFLEYNKKYRITFFFTVPPIYLLIAKSPLVTDQFDSLRHAVSGAAPMGKELQRLASQKLGCHISQTWGLSETTGSVTLMAWDENDETGSVSPLMPGASMRIVDENDRDVEEGQPGEMLMVCSFETRIMDRRRWFSRCQNMLLAVRSTGGTKSITYNEYTLWLRVLAIPDNC